MLAANGGLPTPRVPALRAAAANPPAGTGAHGTEGGQGRPVASACGLSEVHGNAEAGE